MKKLFIMVSCTPVVGNMECLYYMKVLTEKNITTFFNFQALSLLVATWLLARNPLPAGVNFITDKAITPVLLSLLGITALIQFVSRKKLKPHAIKFSCCYCLFSAGLLVSAI